MLFVWFLARLVIWRLLASTGGTKSFFFGVRYLDFPTAKDTR